jgi:hypothetical protein
MTCYSLLSVIHQSTSWLESSQLEVTLRLVSQLDHSQLVYMPADKDLSWIHPSWQILKLLRLQLVTSS